MKLAPLPASTLASTARFHARFHQAKKVWSQPPRPAAVAP
jgi:hypothetical protein